MRDDELLRELATLFHQEQDGSLTWPWKEGLPLQSAGSQRLQEALRTYRDKHHIQNQF